MIAPLTLRFANVTLNTEMELPHRKSRDEDERSNSLEETNDVRSSLQGPLREGGPRGEDAGFFGGAPPTAASTRIVPHTIFLISAVVYAA